MGMEVYEASNWLDWNFHAINGGRFNLQNSSESCQKSCLLDKWCQKWTWVKADGSCYLMNEKIFLKNSVRMLFIQYYYVFSVWLNCEVLPVILKVKDFWNGRLAESNP